MYHPGLGYVEFGDYGRQNEMILKREAAQKRILFDGSYFSAIASSYTFTIYLTVYYCFPIRLPWKLPGGCLCIGDIMGQREGERGGEVIP